MKVLKHCFPPLKSLNMIGDPLLSFFRKCMFLYHLKSFNLSIKQPDICSQNVKKAKITKSFVVWITSKVIKTQTKTWAIFRRVSINKKLPSTNRNTWNLGWEHSSLSFGYCINIRSHYKWLIFKLARILNPYFYYFACFIVKK